MKQGTIFAVLLIVGGGIWYYKNSPAAKRNWVLNWAAGSAGGNEVIPIFKSMTDTEIAYVYDYLKNYLGKGVQVPPGSSLFAALDVISRKYNIFT